MWEGTRALTQHRHVHAADKPPGLHPICPRNYQQLIRSDISPANRLNALDSWAPETVQYKRHCTYFSIKKMQEKFPQRCGCRCNAWKTSVPADWDYTRHRYFDATQCMGHQIKLQIQSLRAFALGNMQSTDMILGKKRKACENKAALHINAATRLGKSASSYERSRLNLASVSFSGEQRRRQ